MYKDTIEVKIAGKNIRCRHCQQAGGLGQYILKGSRYVACAITGYYGSYHESCFNKYYKNLETKIRTAPVIHRNRSKKTGFTEWELQIIDMALHEFNNSPHDNLAITSDEKINDITKELGIAKKNVQNS